ncbi:hypothetical protein TNCV_1057791 [Trichonephila clavipes]|nr:hypothetical protein TNCV_1057791 [Trichonephila clavipes]
MADVLSRNPVESIVGEQKLVMVSDGTEFAVGDIENRFDEARKNTMAKHEKWVKYYNRQRRDVVVVVGLIPIWSSETRPDP